MACVTCLYTRHSCRGSIDISDVFGSKYRKSEVSNISVKTASFKAFRGFLEIKQTNKQTKSCCVHAFIHLDRPAGVRKWIGGEGHSFCFPRILRLMPEFFKRNRRPRFLICFFLLSPIVFGSLLVP